MKKNQFTPADHKEIILGPSEHGGSSTIIFYFSSDYKPVEKQHATRAIAHEYDDKGRSMHREYFVLREGVVVPSQELSDKDFSDGFEDKIVVTRRKAWNSNKNSSSQKQRTNSNHQNQRSRSNQQGNKPASQPTKEGNRSPKKRNTRPNNNKQQTQKNKAITPVASGARASDIPNRPKRSRPPRNNNANRPTSTKAP